MLSRKTIGFIGAGNLAEALVKGLTSSGTVSAGRIIAADKVNERLLHMAETYEIEVYSKNHEAARKADVLFITVKPQDVEAALRDIAPELDGGKLLISVAAGMTTNRVLSILEGSGARQRVPVVRAMPNTPATVKEGMTALYGGGVKPGDLDTAKTLFEAVGKVITVEDESLLDAVTGLSGSGPAYVFLFMESLIEAGVKAGLRESDARVLAVQTTLGAARLALESPLALKELIRKVASPGGTTIEGLKKLDERGFRDALLEAVEAATKRARELSSGA